MMPKIRIKAISDIIAERALQTYYNYIDAYALEIDDIEVLCDQQLKLPRFIKLQGGSDSTKIDRPLYRGLLTWEAMKSLPIDGNPELAKKYNFWAPVWAYYAINGVGWAALHAIGISNIKETHSDFRNHFARQIVEAKLLPRPFNAFCKGNTIDDITTQFDDSKLTSCEIRDTSNLSNPKYCEPDKLIMKALLTTRDGDLKQRFKDYREKWSKKKLKLSEKVDIAGKYHSTTIVDFLYRMRIRSNYENPAMYFRQLDTDSANQHYSNLIKVTSAMISLLSQIIKRKIGRQAWSRLKKGFNI